MKMFNKNGATANCHKDQKEIMLKAGWSRTPFVVTEEVPEKPVVEEIIGDVPVAAIPKEILKKKKRKK